MHLQRMLFLAGITCVSSVAAAPVDPPTLERAWHRCLREAYAHQPAGQSRAGDERNALDECKDHEDAYVAAVMSVHSGDNPRVDAWTEAQHVLGSAKGGGRRGAALNGGSFAARSRIRGRPL